MRRITQVQFDRVRDLLRRSIDHRPLMQREIAERVGISERTVRSIVAGKITRPPSESEIPLPAGPRMHDEIEFALVDSYRCTGCGHFITLSPCLICHERAKRRPYEL